MIVTLPQSIKQTNAPLKASKEFSCLNKYALDFAN